MTRTLLALLLALTSAPASAADAALGALLNARAAAGPVFDGSRLGVPISDPVRADGDWEAGPAVLERKAAEEPTAPAQPGAAVLPTPVRGLSGGHIGLYPESDFVLGTGRCEACRGPREGKWYFLDEVIATPKTGKPAIVWLGSKEMEEGVVLSDDGKTATLADGTALPFALTPRIDSNRSYWNPDSLAHLKGRKLRIRGEFAEVDGVRVLVARTVWPEDYRLDLSAKVTSDAMTSEEVDKLVASDKGGAKQPFETKLLWAKGGSAAGSEGKPVMGFMLNGAQGDDDESLGGHFSMFTGRVGAGGSMADWMFDNFYGMDSYSEKGIVASMVPMDKYMTDLNSGQSWYRPTYMLVMVMKDQRVPLQYQERFKDAYADYYAHRTQYDKTTNPCTALIVDPVRGEGWRIPETGKTPALVARAIAKLASLGGKDPEMEENLYRVLRQEGTHLYPRAAFDSAAGDVLAMTNAYGTEPAGREYNELEKAIQEDLEAVYWVRLPQIPSSRAYGRDPAGGFLDYFGRVPMDRSKWQTVPTQPRPFPPPGARP
ncbi:hypothetical protein EPO15_00990 [bacterium]|nr:MAG: hypothetical protein EPO15_00990 [bacterium]